uniref:GBF1-like tetratricopeptide repeats domain-containing protein n=1 Tax=Meloidogyne javanica TaxID=6303 RepID=A0A915LUS1_MELJA
GWKNVLDCLIYLLRANLLPPKLLELEDFVDIRGIVTIKEKFKRPQILPKKEESGLFSWLGLSVSSISSETELNKKQINEEEQQLCYSAISLISECHPEQLITDSRYLTTSAFTELINNIIHCSFAIAPIQSKTQQIDLNNEQIVQNYESQGSQSQDDDSIVDLSSAAAALLPEEQQILEKQMSENNKMSPLNSPSKSPPPPPLPPQLLSQSSLSINEDKKSGDEQQPIIQQQQNLIYQYSPIKLTLDEEEALIFLLELMINIVLENRDRLAQVWPLVRDHLQWLLSPDFAQNKQITERSIIALIRIANRNLFRLGHPQQNVKTPPPPPPLPSAPRTALTKSVVIVVEDEQTQQENASSQTIQHKTNCCADDVLQFMGRKILELRPSDLLLFSQQISNGLQQLLRANAANVHSAEHWAMFFSILEAVGAAAYQDDDFDLVDIIHPVSSSPPAPLTSPQQPSQQPPPSDKSLSFASGSSLYKRGTIVLAPNLSRHDSAAFLKVVETLGFLGRDAVHITPENFGLFIHCLRMMVEASMDGGKYSTPIQSLTITSPTSPNKQTGNSSSNTSSKQFHVPHENSQKQRKTNEDASGDLTESEEKMSDQEKLANCYVDASLQLLNICAQLQARAANIYKDWSETNENIKIDEAATKTTELWSKYWRPLMQAIARMACDCRRLIRKQALEALGTAFRVPALGELMIPADWEDCFAEVLFPLLSRLLTGSPPISPMDPIGMEEARIRAIQLACKVLLGNLTKITSLKSFPDLFLRLFDLMDQFLEENACSDLLAEVIQESLKNCILVCENFGVFQSPIEGLKAEISGRLEALTVKHSNSANSKVAL